MRSGATGRVTAGEPSIGSLRAPPLVSKVASSAVVSDVLDLKEDSIRIGEIKFGSPLRGSAAIWHSHRHIVFQRAGGLTLGTARSQTVLPEQTRDPVGGKIDDRKTGVMNEGFDPASDEGEKLVSIANAKDRHRALIGVDTEAEEPLIELHVPLGIGHEDGEMIVVVQLQQAAGGN